MAIKRWLITAEVNMDASRHESIVIKANSARKALIMGEKKLLKSYFHVTNMTYKLITDGDSNG